jgi:hypothetical protein
MGFDLPTDRLTAVRGCTMSTIAERVAAGAAWLDEHEPGWRQRIDWDRLDLGNCTRCIGGQLAGVYLAFLRRHDLDSEAAHLLGFTLMGSGCDFDQLTATWRRLIDTRRATPGGGS